MDISRLGIPNNLHVTTLLSQRATVFPKFWTGYGKLKPVALPIFIPYFIVKNVIILNGSLSRVQAGSNTSTVALRVVGSDKKGSLKSETVKYGHESHGTRTQKLVRWGGPERIVNDSPVLSSERAPHINKPATV
jgi:hypothetical protein